MTIDEAVALPVVGRRARPGVPWLDSVDSSVYVDPAVFAAEQQRIFRRTWQFLAHDCEIPNNGDFVVRYIADDSIIVSRGNDGVVRAFLNVCTHRGMQVCRADLGNTRRFTCPYHGWGFDSEGRLVSVPLERHFGPDGVDRAAMGLQPIAQLENFDGLWFGNLSADAPTLTEYLGDFAWYLKIYTARDPQGTEVLGEPQRWRVPGNWKIACENVMGDSYHVQTTHRSVFECGIHPNQAKDFTSAGARNGIHIDAGHGTTGLSRQSAVDRGYPPEMQEMFRETLSREHAELLFGDQPKWPTRAHLFPNFSLLCAGARISPTELYPYILMRTWRPIDADTIEVWSWVLVEKSATPEFKEKSGRAYVLTFGPAGTEEVDDAENWSSMQRAFHGVGTRDIPQVLTMGTPDEMQNLEVEDWPAPGTAVASSYTDAGNRRFHSLWREYMGAQ